MESRVLILIVMDNGLIPLTILNQRQRIIGLNPYCNGQWSHTLKSMSNDQLHIKS